MLLFHTHRLTSKLIFQSGDFSEILCIFNLFEDSRSLFDRQM